MFSTFYYLFGCKEKEWIIVLFFIDLLLLLGLAFYAGTQFDLLGVLLWTVFFFAVFHSTCFYDDWRNERRKQLRNNPEWKGEFPEKWVSYADLWTQLLGRGMSKYYVALLVLGKLYSMIF